MSSQISIHALLAESDVKAYRQPAYHTEFLSTLSLRRATGENKKIKVIRIFLSTLSLRRATLIFAARHPAIRVFLSTLSLRRATPGRAPLSRVIVISIHALLAESDDNVCPMFMFVTISIHALLAESDARRDSRQQPAGISIHALLAESDYQRLSSDFRGGYFYPRSPCGERLSMETFYQVVSSISIHALLAESDGPELGQLFGALISIHALLAESDPKSFRGRRCPANFYPRSPCGERRNATGHGPDGRLFLSTLSLRRATVTGSESQKLILHFYPRSPCGERLGAPVERMPSSSISIHALLAESDFNNGVALVPHQQISIHALLAESDSQWRTLASGM